MAVPAVVAAVVEEGGKVIIEVVKLLDSLRALLEKMPGPEQQAIARMHRDRP